ncbi:MAG: universal stress protein [Desulfobacteraceae bacterium]|nr:MAG: universal stress protein [Desulfobacteraceae bacterium]
MNVSMHNDDHNMGAILETKEKKVLVALNDSMSSKAVIEFIIRMPLCPEEWHIYLLHILRKSSASEELMGRKFTAEQPERMVEMLRKAKMNLIRNGFREDRVSVQMAEHEYPTVTDGIIDQHQKYHYDLVVIGRKSMSKAEEFVMGDISIKLIRLLKGTAVLVVTS